MRPVESCTAHCSRPWTCLGVHVIDLTSPQPPSAAAEAAAAATPSLASTYSDRQTDRQTGAASGAYDIDTTARVTACHMLVVVVVDVRQIESSFN